MNKWLTGCAVIAIVLPMGATAMAQMEDVKITTTKVVDGLYMLQGRGGNIGVSIGNDGVFLIDDQFAPLTDKITAAVSELSDKPIQYVFNTHLHGDHTGGNENLGNQGITIVAHDNVRKRMSDNDSPEAALPVITFNDKMSFHFNGNDIRVIHHPHSHTDGDAILHFTNHNVVYTGDLFFNGDYPYVDTKSGGSFDGLIRTVEKLMTLIDEDTRIIPGHGPLASKKDLQVYLDMLKDVRSKLLVFLNQKLSLSAVELKDPLQEYDDKWGNGFMKPEVWLKIIYTDMAKQ
ncbi:MAG: MBL fold metallo-hydrolase [Gammaproteobacteria bacterium]